MSLVRLLIQGFAGAKQKVTFLVALCIAVAMTAVMPVLALATETETESKIKAVTTQVATEGVSIILAVLTGLVALIAAVIIIPKAVGFIRRFV